MSTGQRLEEEFGPFEDEVLGANWTPQPGLDLGLQEAVASRPEPAAPPADLEAWMRRFYLSQE